MPFTSISIIIGIKKVKISMGSPLFTARRHIKQRLKKAKLPTIYLRNLLIQATCDCPEPLWVNYWPQLWVELGNELSWLFTDRLSTTRCMKAKRMGITEILGRICLFSANKLTSSKSFTKQHSHLIVKLNSSLRQINDSLTWSFTSKKLKFYNWFRSC